MNSVRIGLGIDLGSTGVRVGAYNLETDEPIAVVSRTVNYYEQEKGRYTQSSAEIMRAIVECFESLNIDIWAVQSCGVAATCSLAVFIRNSTKGLQPFGVYEDLRPLNDQNVVFWMDSNAIEECSNINDLAINEKAYFGGSFIPEMGVPKLASFLKSCSKNNSDFEVFDLHTYVAYDLANRYGWDASFLINRPNHNGIGHDGEIKGWKDEFYEKTLKLPPNVRIGPLCINRRFSPVKVASCIDCYSSWFSMFSSTPERSLFMAAGTSTCYLYANNKPSECLPGIWGPFTDILDSKDPPSWSVYEAGQSTTGKLIEHLFESHPAAKPYLEDRNVLFNRLETEINLIEQQSAESVHFKTKHMFNYGELQGNRTPYCDPEMSGMFIGESADTSFRDLTLKYVTVLEFLAFQVRHIKECLGAPINDIRVAGSQAKNNRLLSLISFVNHGSRVRIPATRADYVGVQGAYLLGKAKHLGLNVVELITQENGGESPMKDIEVRIEKNEENKLRALFEIKYKIYLNMAQTQRQYREMVNAALT